MAKKKSEHYVNNKEFSQALVDYVKVVKAATDEGLEPPQIPDYIGECIVRICEGYSRKPNFIRYSFRDEMVMDAQYDCVKAVMKFDASRETRTGLPNAFAFMTQIAYFAFLRRIAKEKKQWEIKLKYMETASIEAFADFGMDDSMHAGDSMIAKIRNRTPSIAKDNSFISVDEQPAKKPASRGWGKKKKILPKKSSMNLTKFIDENCAD
jgi:hypothetical protein